MGTRDSWFASPALLHSRVPMAVTPTGSPFTYAAARDGIFIVPDGTVSLIEVGYSGSFYQTGVAAGMFPLMRGDSIRLTYTVAPTSSFVPN